MPKIYVGNLPYQTDSETLQQLFEAYGAVTDAIIITDRETGRSRGFGFVEMPDEEAAKNAQTELNGHEYEGRKLTVNEARPRQSGPAN